jgi:proteasome lid subunit RPN8/RPN11
MLFLTKNDYDKILKHCEAGLPDEACGLIGGTKDGNDKGGNRYEVSTIR